MQKTAGGGWSLNNIGQPITPVSAHTTNENRAGIRYFRPGAPRGMTAARRWPAVHRRIRHEHTPGAVVPPTELRGARPMTAPLRPSRRHRYAAFFGNHAELIAACRGAPGCCRKLQPGSAAQQNLFERAGHRIGHVGDPEIVGVARTTVHGAQGADRADAELVDRLQRELLGAVEHLGVQQ